MSVRNGYGNLSERLESLEVLGVLQPSNRNAIIQLPPKNEKRTNYILDCAYNYANYSNRWNNQPFTKQRYS